MNKESLVLEQKDYASIGEQISHEYGAKIIKNHHDKYGYENSSSFIIGKTAIQQLLDQPGCIGIRYVEAINEFGIKTLVYVGIDEKGNNIVEESSVNVHGDIAVTEGMIFDKSEAGGSWFA